MGNPTRYEAITTHCGSNSKGREQKIRIGRLNCRLLLLGIAILLHRRIGRGDCSGILKFETEGLTVFPAAGYARQKNTLIIGE